MKQDKIEKNFNELIFFKTMLNNFGNELKEIENNYKILSKSKKIYIFY